MSDVREAEHRAEPLPRLFRHFGQAWFLLVTGVVGLGASFMLAVEYVHNLTEPDADLLCDFSVFITCGPAMQSHAGAVLGFPNIFLGLVCFTIIVVTAVVLFAGVKLPRWYWIGLQIGMIGGAVLVTYLQWMTGYRIGALCLWCMIIWVAMIPLAALTTIANLAHGRLGEGGVRIGRALADWAWVVVVIWYLAVIGFVLGGMWDTIRLAMI